MPGPKANINVFCPYCGASDYKTPISVETQSFSCRYCNGIITREMYSPINYERERTKNTTT